MELRLLGPMEARVGDTVVPLGPRQQRLVLAMLAWEANRLVPVARLVEWVWPAQPPPSAAHAVRVQVSNLRSLLLKAGVDATEVEICTQGPGYLLRTDPLRVDVHRFQRRIGQARAALDDRRRLELLEQALDLWTGPVLADTATAEIRERLFSGLEETRLVAVEDRFDLLLRLGRHREVLGELTALVAVHPTRERLICQLMLALYLGAQADRALEVARRTRMYLSEELGIDPSGELRQLELAILRGDPALNRPAPAPSPPEARPRAGRPPEARTPAASAPEARPPAGRPPEARPPEARTPGARTPEASAHGALPAPRTRLIGREAEVSEVVKQLAAGEARLLTLTGPGGVGKTRFALEVAARLTDQFPDGVAFVALAPLLDPGLVLPTIAGCLAIPDLGGMPLREMLRGYLQGQHVLVLLDNLEHLLDAVPDLGWLLDAAPGLTVLATSRSPLRLRGEYVRQVEPLDAPSAADLFTERARQADSASSHVDPRVVDAVCGLLDCLPLAIELAAARTRVLPAAVLLDQLGRSHDLLAGGARDLPPRHQTLRDTIAWSYDLLTADEQAMLRSVAIFTGGWTLEAATAVADVDPASAVELHSRLLDTSLIIRRPDRDAARFFMLQTIRHFVLAQAEPADVAGRTVADCRRERHAAYYEDFIKAVREGSEGTNQFGWLDRLYREHDNLRTAMRWLLDHSRLDRFAGIFVLWQLWAIKGRFSECQRWAAEALNAPDAALSPGCRAGVLALFSLGLAGSDPDEAVRIADESVRLARQSDDLPAQAMALLVRGHLAVWRADNGFGLALLDEADTVMSALSWTSSRTLVRAVKASVVIELGRPEEADRTLAALEARLRRIGGSGELATVLSYRALARFRLGDREHTERLLRETLAIWDQLGSTFAMMFTLSLQAATAALAGHPERSAQLAGAASALIDRFGPGMIGGVRRDGAQARAKAIAAIGPATYDALFEEGRAMTWDEVLTLAGA